MKTRTFSNILAASIGLVFATAAHAAQSSALSQAVKPVYDHYLKIETALANDSLAGVSEQAQAISRAVEGDSMKTLPARVASQAKILAAAKDLKQARSAFKPLSDSLIQYLADHHVPKGTYVEVYCSMAKASWLQADKNVKNPYMGRMMLNCGVVKE